MPVLAAGTALRQRVPTVLVENRLEPGAWRFRLTVVDDAGNESAPAELVVQIVRPGTPVRPIDPPLRPIDPNVLRDPVRPVMPVTPIRRPS